MWSVSSARRGGDGEAFHALDTRRRVLDAMYVERIAVE